MFLFTGKRVPEDWLTVKGYPGNQFSVTENGWMTGAVFLEWFKMFCDDVDQRPLLLIYDGHASRITLDLILHARDENVTLLKLPPHTTDKLQPLDVCVFKSLKTQWDIAIDRWSKENKAMRINKPEFIELTGNCETISLQFQFSAFIW